MKHDRKLALRRDALADLTAADLGGLAAGAPRTEDCTRVLDTMYSCLDYISCHVVDCLLDPATA